MRLIDAKNVKELLTSLATVPNVIIEKWLNEHTVRAIPVEWIERKLAEHWYVDYDIRELLEDWEAEYEVNRRR